MNNLLIVTRSFIAIGGVLAISAGMTYAALNTQASLRGSSISTASADLKIWDGSDYTDSAPGFRVENLSPGQASAEYPIYFKNTGSTGMALGVRIPTALKFSGFNSTNTSIAMKAVKATIKNLATSEKTETTLNS
jgi:hypothetical protein